MTLSGSKTTKATAPGTLIVGFGPYAEAAVRVLLGRGRPVCSIWVWASSKEEAVRASDYGLLVAEVEATALTQDKLPRRMIVDLADSAAALAVVREVTGSKPPVEVIVALHQPEHREAFLAEGASEIVCPASLTGRLLARSLTPYSGDRTSVH